MGTNGGSLGDLWEYNEGSNSWNVRASYGGSARKGAIAMIINNRAYVGTGKGTSGKKASMHEYNPYYTVGVNELENAISIYPNPTEGIVNIEMSEFKEATVYTLSGKRLLRSKVKSIDISALSEGVYLIKLEDRNGASVYTLSLIHI